jgi:hypothetical protein
MKLKLGMNRVPRSWRHLSGARLTSQKIWARTSPDTALWKSALSTATVISSSVNGAALGPGPVTRGLYK